MIILYALSWLECSGRAFLLHEIQAKAGNPSRHSEPLRFLALRGPLQRRRISFCHGRDASAA